MRLLILTAWYAPFIHPRAHRWTALAEYWAAQGYEVHVVCGRLRGMPKEAMQHGVHLHRTGFDSLKEIFYHCFGSQNARGRVGQPPQKSTLAGRLAAWLYRSVWKNICFPDDACFWYFPAKKRAIQLLRQQPFDAFISVSLPFTGHLVGLEIKRHFPGLSWLADIGDPFSFSPNPMNNRLLFHKTNCRLERHILKSAHCSVVTTAAMRRQYAEEFGKLAVATMHIIPPLFHPQPLAKVNKTRQGLGARSVPLKIAYFGALYAPVRTPDALLDLLLQTFALRPALRAQLEVHFYGEIFPEFFERLSLEPCIRLHGLCTREAVQTAMQETDVLLNIGNTTDFQLPSKAVDYLGAGKPIVHLSYTERDPLIVFFEENLLDKSLILNLKVKQGRVGVEEVRRWVDWLGAEKTPVDEDDLAQRMAPFGLDQIAKQYLQLILHSH